MDIKNRRGLESVKEEEVSSGSKEVRKDIERNQEDKETKISLKALAVISSWNKYSSETKISKSYHKLINKLTGRT